MRLYLDHLVSTAPEIKGLYGGTRPNANRGKKLQDFSFTSVEDLVMYDMYGNAKTGRYRRVMDEVRLDESLPASERLMKDLCYFEHVTDREPQGNIEMLFDRLEDMGVEMDLDGANEILQLFMNFHNGFHSWSMHGWSPEELRDEMPYDGIPQIQFGPNIERMIESGEYDREELVRMIEEQGFDLTDSSKYGKN